MVVVSAVVVVSVVVVISDVVVVSDVVVESGAEVVVDSDELGMDTTLVVDAGSSPDIVDPPSTLDTWDCPPPPPPGV